MRAARLTKLPPYLFVEIERKKAALVEEGRDVIDLGVGDPDIPTPAPIVAALQGALGRPGIFRYPDGRGIRPLREAIATWHEKRTGVRLDPQQEVLALIGAKEGIGHLPLAVVDPGDACLIPEPNYPPYLSGTHLAGGEPYILPLRAESGFLPDLDSIPTPVLERARLLFLNYPNNPTTAMATAEFYERVVALARRWNLLVAADATYAEIYFDRRPISFLEIPGAREVGVEYHSFSKTFCMTGWRLAWVVGRSDVLDALASLKSNLDSGAFLPIQHAGIAALTECEREQRSIVEVFRARRDVFVNGLRDLGVPCARPPATFYVWVPTPPSVDSFTFSARLLESAAIVTTPGRGFGPSAEGFVRAALTTSEARIRLAIERIGSCWEKLSHPVS